MIWPLPIVTFVSLIAMMSLFGFKWFVYEGNYMVMAFNPILTRAVILLKNVMVCRLRIVTASSSWAVFATGSATFGRDCVYLQANSIDKMSPDKCLESSLTQRWAWGTRPAPAVLEPSTIKIRRYRNMFLCRWWSEVWILHYWSRRSQRSISWCSNWWQCFLLDETGWY